MILFLLITLSLAPLAAVMAILRGRTSPTPQFKSGNETTHCLSNQSSRSGIKPKLLTTTHSAACSGVTGLFSSPAQEQRVRREILTKILRRM